MEKKTLQFAVETKALNADELEVTVNSGLTDRTNEILNMKGLDISHYLNNPVVLWGHDYSQPPIGKAIKVWKDANGSLKAIVKFAVEEYDFAKLVKKLFDGGFMSAFSIGFMPYEAQETKEGALEYIKSQMLEFSAVVVPADPMALATQSKSLGVSEDTLEKFYNGTLKIKKYKEPEEKGAVADELAGETTEEKKYANMRKFWAISSAFCNAYMHEETAVDDFADMVKETIGLMEQLADGTLVIPDAQEGDVLRSVKGMLVAVKAGKVLSSKNRQVIESAKAALEEVLAADAQPTNDKPVDENSKEMDGIEHATSIAKKAIEAVEANTSQTSGRSSLQRAKQAAVCLDKAGELLITQIAQAMKKKGIN